MRRDKDQQQRHWFAYAELPGFRLRVGSRAHVEAEHAPYDEADAGKDQASWPVVNEDVQHAKRRQKESDLGPSSGVVVERGLPSEVRDDLCNKPKDSEHDHLAGKVRGQLTSPSE